MRCGLEMPVSEIDWLLNEHDCSDPESWATIACACWGGGPGGQLCCQALYERQRRFLLQRIANILAARRNDLFTAAYIVDHIVCACGAPMAFYRQGAVQTVVAVCKCGQVTERNY